MARTITIALRDLSQEQLALLQSTLTALATMSQEQAEMIVLRGHDGFLDKATAKQYAANMLRECSLAIEEERLDRIY